MVMERCCLVSKRGHFNSYLKATSIDIDCDIKGESQCFKVYSREIKKVRICCLLKDYFSVFSIKRKIRGSIDKFAELLYY